MIRNYNAATRIISTSSSDVTIWYGCVSSLFDLTVSHCTYFIVIQAELYQINTSRTLCTREEAVFICSNNDGPVIKCIVFTVTGVQVNIGLHSKFTKIQESTVPSTLVRGEVIDGNSTYFVATLTLVPPVSSTILCNDEIISYRLQNCKWSLF